MVWTTFTGGAGVVCGPPVALTVQVPTAVLAWYVEMNVPLAPVVPAGEPIVPQVPVPVMLTASPGPASPPPGTVMDTVRLDMVRPSAGIVVGEALSATA